MHKWSDDRWCGVLLIAAAAVGLFVMAHHPTASHILHAANPADAAQMNRILHAIAIAAMPIQFIGLLGLTRRLGPSLCNHAGLVTQAFGLIAGMGAAVASGFVASGVMLDMVQAGTSAEPSALLGYTAMWNQGFAVVYLIATTISVVLWSVAMLSSTVFPKALGWLGLVVGTAVTLWQVFGIRHTHHIGVHELGLAVLGEAIWMVWAGVVMIRSTPGS